MHASRLPSLLLALAALGCGEVRPGLPRPDDTGDTDAFEVTDTRLPDPDTTTSKPDADAVPTDTGGDADAADTSDERDLEVPDLVGEVDSEDVPRDGNDADTADADASPVCVDGDPCQVQGYVPPCYEGRCQGSTCQLRRIPGCCSSDAECAGGSPRPCAVDRCILRECRTLDLPGCCTDDDACDDGLASTDDACSLEVGRCAHCPLPCAGRAPIWSALFDRPGDTVTGSGLTILDAQPGDLVTWQRTTSRTAAGDGALYLGNPRCETYYGGALDAACAPTQTGEQDSQRVTVALVTPLVTLPSASPASLVAWVRSAVEPDRGRGLAEPDVLRVEVEPLGLGTTWELASTLALGKSTDWAPMVLDLGPYAGQTVRIRFEFDTLDGESNRFPGVWLDEIVVQEACASGGCCASDADCPASVDPCRRAACLATSEGGPNLCTSVPRAPGASCTACANDLGCDDQDPCTSDRCEGPADAGSCTHTTFCCLERDLLEATFGANFVGVTPLDDTPGDGVRWQARDGAAWFGDPVSGTYVSSPPGRVSGSLESPLLELPRTAATGDAVRLDLDLRLSTEWDLAVPGPPGDAISNPAGLDRVTLEVLDGPFVTTLWTSDAIGGTTLGQPLGLTFDLERWLGRAVRLRLRFDTGDELANAFPGIFIDRLTLGLRCGLP